MRIALISDIHEDITRLEMALRIIEDKNCDHILCLGDIVGFNLPNYKYPEQRDASACIGLVRRHCDLVLKGNHDLFAIQALPEHRAGVDYPQDYYKLDYESKLSFGKDLIWIYDNNELPIDLSDDEKQYLASLPEYEVKTYGGINFYFTHFIYPDVAGSKVYSAEKFKDLDAHFRKMEEMDCLMSFSGHGHIDGVAHGTKAKVRFLPFGLHKLQHEMQWIDGPAVAYTPRPSGFSIFDTDSMELEVIRMTF